MDPVAASVNENQARENLSSPRISRNTGKGTMYYDCQNNLTNELNAALTDYLRK
ncbi:hypothetical protein CHS0354_031473, partial [Potamilus streckersoni]